MVNSFCSLFGLEFMKPSLFIVKNVSKEGVYGLGEVKAFKLPFNFFSTHNIKLHSLNSHRQMFRHFPVCTPMNQILNLKLLTSIFRSFLKNVIRYMHYKIFLTVFFSVWWKLSFNEKYTKYNHNQTNNINLLKTCFFIQSQFILNLLTML